MLELFTIAPDPAVVRMASISATMASHGPFRFTAEMASKVFSSTVSSGPGGIAIAALLKATSSRPNTSTARATAARTLAASEMSQTTYSASPPASPHLPGHRGQLILGPGGEHHPGALAGEQPGRRGTDPTAGPSDERDLAGEQADPLLRIAHVTQLAPLDRHDGRPCESRGDATPPRRGTDRPGAGPPAPRRAGTGPGRSPTRGGAGPGHGQPDVHPR